MDTKNVIAAITLIVSSNCPMVAFYDTRTTTKKNSIEKNKIEQNTDTPSLEQKETLVTISRDEALNQSERIKFENDNIVGSISLKRCINR